MGRAAGVKFGALVLALELVFVILMAVFAEYRTPSSGVPGTYPNFQDVNVMVFIGLGFLVTFLKNYGYSAVSLNLVVGGFCVQWAFLVRGFIHSGSDNVFALGVGEMTTALFASATVLISYCVLLGKVSATQLLVMAMIEIPIAQLNEYIGYDLLHTRDIGESMYLHMFAAYFGLAASRVLWTEDIENASAKEGATYTSDLLAMIGSVFLWIYWPSFNGGFSDDFSERATLNTFLSLCACAVVTFAVSAMTDPHGRFDMVHIQNASLAGGVVVGAIADFPMQPWAALVFGAVGGAVCVLGYRFLTPLLASKLKVHDTCGVHNLHGLPAIIAAVGAAVLAGRCGDWDEADRLSLFPETFPNATIVPGALGRSPGAQAGYQIAACGMTIAMAVVGGAVTGLIMKLPLWDAPGPDGLFDDKVNFELPEDAAAPAKKI